MSSIIEELFYGNIKPNVKHFDPDSPYGQATRLKDKNFDKLMAALDDDEKELFDKYCGAQEEMDNIALYYTFTYALRFGILLMAEVFTGKGEITGKEDGGNV